MTKTVQIFTITNHHDGQRIDNFLVAHLKGVPKSHIFQMVRSGGVRVNKKRVKPNDRLKVGDIVRVPPVRTIQKKEIDLNRETMKWLKDSILFEDENMIVINKPCGVPVHSGSGQTIGVIEAFRKIYDNPYLDLAHRIDKETSGCLVIAKTRTFLKEFHDLFREQKVEKTYLALVKGKMEDKKHLEKLDVDGKESETLFVRLKIFQNVTLVEAYPKSGRTHQIRVHAAAMGHPIMGDDKYGDKDFNKSVGARRLHLHAHKLQFTLAGQKPYSFEAPLLKSGLTGWEG
jgi:23S rRNA pseudouridine955/2504/2580 synthase